MLRDEDEREEKEQEQAELECRRNMKDEERHAEDIASGKYQRPGMNRDPSKSTGKFMQRYYHKGAFYTDEDTLTQAGEDDVRKRADEYARAATGHDKVDFKALPEVMHVKKFGFARHSTKYKGLTREDTTDKNSQYLSLSNRRRTTQTDEQDHL